MKAKDIYLIQTCAMCPEQYDAVDEFGNIVGYLRMRWGWFLVYCPDVDTDATVYEHQYQNAYLGAFPSNSERKKHLRRAKAAIALWWSQRAS